MHRSELHAWYQQRPVSKREHRGHPHRDRTPPHANARVRREIFSAARAAARNHSTVSSVSGRSERIEVVDLARR
jgi:hypothetical protein